MTFCSVLGRPSLQFSLYLYCTVGRRAELETGMAGKDPWLCRGMLDETAESIATMDTMVGGRIEPDGRAVAHPAT